MKILLVGYYGQGNLGDDVLMLVTYNIICRYFPEAEIFIFCDSNKEKYLPTFIKEKYKTIHPGNRDFFDLIVHGGGGNFFDFNHSGYTDYIVNKIIQAVGCYRYAKIDFFIRNILRKRRYSGSQRIALGIGVGTYTKSSKKMKHDIITFSDFKKIIVRDYDSYKNIINIGIYKEVLIGSDLVFMDEYWLDKTKIYSTAKNKKRIGLILRDCFFCDFDYIDFFKKNFNDIFTEYEVSLFIFDKERDVYCQELSSVCNNTYIWSPNEVDLNVFLSYLEKQDIVISSRAHGIICSAILDVPSIVIEIEDKLKNVHEMLKKSTFLLRKYDFDIDQLKKIIIKTLNINRSSIKNDVSKNKEMIASLAIDALKK